MERFIQHLCRTVLNVILSLNQSLVLLFIFHLVLLF